MTRSSVFPVERRWINPLAIPAYIAALSAAFFIAATSALTEFTYDAAAINPVVFAFMALILLGAVLARRGLKIGSAMEAMGLFGSLNFAAPFCAVILASMAPPLVDTTLANL
ncbi:MAG: hypothetical protein JSR79_08060, partial [Proteobacteria bacterium]|nr:hypothetical protein [Pseudomonadota bacterium]